MKIRRILAIVLMVAVMMSVVGCGNANQNNENSNGINDVVGDSNDVVSDNNDEEVVIDPLVDVEYTPNTEGLIGFAVYPVKNGVYPYNEGDIVEGRDNCIVAGWRMVFTKCLDDGYNTFCPYDFSKENNNTEGTEYTTTYIAESLLVWGYVYQQGEDVFIVTTRDIVNYDENGSVTKDVTVGIEGSQSHTLHFVVKQSSNNN